MIPSNTLVFQRKVTRDGLPALEALNNIEELAKEDIRQCFLHGAVWLESVGKPQRLYDRNTPLRAGNVVHLYCNPTTLSACPYRPQLIRDFIDYSIWFKPSGMLSQGSKWGDHWTLHRWIRLNHWPDRRTFITHRLDRYTQGLMIVAHDKSINQRFHRLFERREIEKAYRAIVNGLAEFKHPQRVETAIDGKPALTLIQALAVDTRSRRSLLEIRPQTGRKHQIRRHLADIGLAVVNDRQYGQAPFDGDLQLQACELGFNNPLDGERLCIRLNNDKLLALPIH